MSRLTEDTTLWLATTRADGSPHLTPIWFVWHDERIWVCTSATHVKARTITRDPRVMVALGTGAKPLVGQGRAVRHARPFPPGARQAFIDRFDWDIDVDDEDGTYDVLFEIAVERWVLGSPDA
jgi:hypothetical protein